MINTVFFNICRNIRAVWYNFGHAVAHGNAVRDIFKHGQVIGAVADSIAVFKRNIQIIAEKLYTGCFRVTFLYDFSDIVATVYILKMFIHIFSESVIIAVRLDFYKNFIKGVFFIGEKVRCDKTSCPEKTPGILKKI